MRLTCQEQLLPGDTLQQKWDAAQAFGYDGIELRGQGGHRIRERLPELHRARRDGVVMNTVCVEDRNRRTRRSSDLVGRAR
jgi:sugar phosphate isomerase/epimerase